MTAFSGSYCDRFRDLLPLHALGSPLHEDAVGLRDHMEGCAACRREVQELQEALALLPYALDQVKPGVGQKERLLRQFRDEAAGAPQATIIPIAGRVRPASGTHGGHGSATGGGIGIGGSGTIGDKTGSRGRGAGTSWALAASFLLFVGSSLLLLREHRRLVRAEAESTALAVQLQEVKASDSQKDRQIKDVQQELQFLHARNIQLVTLQPPGGSVEEAQQAVGHILWDRDHRAWLFLAFQLPAIPEDKDYQLWFLVKGPEAAQPVSAGLVHTTGTGEVSADIQVPPEVGEITAAALTLEPKGGSEKPTTDPLLVGQI